MKLQNQFIRNYKNVRAEELQFLLGNFTYKSHRDYLITMCEWNELFQDNILLKAESFPNLEHMITYCKFISGEISSIDSFTRRQIVNTLSNLPFIFIEIIEFALKNTVIDTKRAKHLKKILSYSNLPEILEIQNKVKINIPIKAARSIDIYDSILQNKADGFYVKDSLINDIDLELRESGYEKTARNIAACLERKEIIYYAKKNIYAIIRADLDEHQKELISEHISTELESFPMISARKLGDLMNEVFPLSGINWKEHDDLIHDYLKKQLWDYNKFAFKRKPIIASGKYENKIIEDAQTDLLTKIIEISGSNDTRIISQYLESIGFEAEYIRNIYSLTRGYIKNKNKLERL